MAFQQQRSRPRVQHQYYHDDDHDLASGATTSAGGPTAASSSMVAAAADRARHAAHGVDGGLVSAHASSTSHVISGTAVGSSSTLQPNPWHEDDEVLLFGGASSIYASAINDTHGPTADESPSSSSWTMLASASQPQPQQHRTLSPATRSSASTSASLSSHSSSNASYSHHPSDLSVSLFPAHDGNGRFLSLSSDSLVQSSNGGGGGGASDDLTRYRQGGVPLSLDAWLYQDQATHYSSDTSHSYTGVRGRRAPSSSEHSWSDLSSQGRAHHDPAGRHHHHHYHHPARSTTSFSDSLSASWALTEAALSTIPDASVRNRLVLQHEAEEDEGQSAGFTSDSSVDVEDNSVEGAIARDARRRAALRRAATPRASSRRMTMTPHKTQEQQDQEDEESLSRTPGAESAGLHLLRRARPHASTVAYEERRGAAGGNRSSSQRSRDAYPSPPPEDLAPLRSKRRHRQSGRSGSSQKRSSTSGSVRPQAHAAHGGASVPSSMPTIAQRREAEQLRLARREQLEGDIWMGRIVGSKLMDIDHETLELVAAGQPMTPEATPTPSRAASPDLVKTPQRREVHGLAALASHAERELGSGTTPMFMLYGAMEEESEESEDEDGDGDDRGTETETEGASSTNKTRTKQWHHSTEPLVFAPRQSSSVAKQPSPAETTAKDTPPRSLSASSLPLYLANNSKLISTRLTPLTTLVPLSTTVESASRLRRTSSFSESDESPWGGEFDGLEAAIVYWRSLWRRIRGLEG